MDCNKKTSYLSNFSGYANKPRSLPANILQRNVGGFLVGLRFHDNCWVSVLELRKCIYKYFVSITKHTRIDHIHHTVFMRISALGTYLIFAIWNFRRRETGMGGWGGGGGAYQYRFWPPGLVFIRGGDLFEVGHLFR